MENVVFVPLSVIFEEGSRGNGTPATSHCDLGKLAWSQLMGTARHVSHGESQVPAVHVPHPGRARSR